MLLGERAAGGEGLAICWGPGSRAGLRPGRTSRTCSRTTRSRSRRAGALKERIWTGLKTNVGCVSILCSRVRGRPARRKRPTFRPSAEWYIQKIDWANALSQRMVDFAVRSNGDDLMVMVRYEGTFTEVFELDLLRPIEVREFRAH